MMMERINKLPLRYQADEYDQRKTQHVSERPRTSTGRYIRNVVLDTVRRSPHLLSEIEQARNVHSIKYLVPTRQQTHGGHWKAIPSSVDERSKLRSEIKKIVKPHGITNVRDLPVRGNITMFTKSPKRYIEDAEFWKKVGDKTKMGGAPTERQRSPTFNRAESLFHELEHARQNREPIDFDRYDFRGRYYGVNPNVYGHYHNSPEEIFARKKAWEQVARRHPTPTSFIKRSFFDDIDTLAFNKTFYQKELQEKGKEKGFKFEQLPPYPFARHGEEKDVLLREFAAEQEQERHENELAKEQTFRSIFGQQRERQKKEPVTTWQSLGYEQFNIPERPKTVGYYDDSYYKVNKQFDNQKREMNPEIFDVKNIKIYPDKDIYSDIPKQQKLKTLQDWGKLGIEEYYE